MNFYAKKKYDKEKSLNTKHSVGLKIYAINKYIKYKFN